MQTKITIIIPVYKSESYINKCLESVASQTFQDWECILIDDGSPDNSGKICDLFATRDSRFVVKHKVNEGVSSARQCGVDMATGEYIIHVDPDDWIESTMLEELYGRAQINSADIVIFDLSIDREYGSKRLIQKPHALNSAVVRKQILLQELHGGCCNKLIRARLYKNGVKFPKQMTCWEDQFVICNILENSQLVIDYIDKAFYHYVFYGNDNSLSRKPNRKTLDSQIFMINNLSSHNTNGEIFYKLKEKTKVLCAAINDDPISLYPEINNEFLCRNSLSLSNPYNNKVILLLSGYNTRIVSLWTSIHIFVLNIAKSLIYVVAKIYTALLK